MKNQDIIVLTGEKELRVYMAPLRQKIIQAMRTEGKPVTSKYIADKLKITPSSASHHIKQLQEIGVIEFHHSEIIKGITANFLKVTEKTISLGININDELSGDRDAIARNMLYDMYSGYLDVTKNIRKSGSLPNTAYNNIADMISGVTHLTDIEVKKLNDIIFEFVNSHQKADIETRPYKYVLMAYRADLENNDKE